MREGYKVYKSKINERIRTRCILYIFIKEFSYKNMVFLFFVNICYGFFY